MLKLGVLPLCLDLFVQFEWHSFLHNIVQSIIDSILSGDNRRLKESLFAECDILGRIVEATKRNDGHVREKKSCRKGYMGQLRLIASEDPVLRSSFPCCHGPRR